VLFDIEEFFSLQNFKHKALFEKNKYVWDALKSLKEYTDMCIAGLEGNQTIVCEEGVSPGAILIGSKNIILCEGCIVEDGACIIGPAIIGKGSIIRHGAYLRGYTLVGENCVIGHASEIKHSIMLDGSKAPHFSYVGDSILGNNTNLGAGTKLSNISMKNLENIPLAKKHSIKITVNGNQYDTGLVKLGAILGDDVQIGCNSVTNPGCLVSRRTLIYPNISLPKGYYPSNSIIKLEQSLQVVERQKDF
jgi:UDP-N-acetylglucosamine diphosphorylase / glucose-1-phosphate thymidylyltransferase / UDP-N-acetylgalactosamine diphosphorylase / glucosamine-1-phosphate N-acetyltransferase / galactosamine-1-phosphate N-acetyltransferase